MATAAERQALAFLAGVALLGGGARLVLQRSAENDLAPSAFASAETVDGQLSAVDSARSSKSSRKRTGAARGGTRAPSTSKRAKAVPENESTLQPFVDVDVATAEELEQLPRVGPALAARIVANRDSLGPFGSMEALGEVRGIGPAMLKLLSPLVTFSARPRQPANRKH